MTYIKQGLIIGVCFFSMLSFTKAQLYVQGLLHVQEEAALHAQDAVIIQTADGQVENKGTIGIEGNLEKANEAIFNTNPDGLGARTVVMTGANNQSVTGNFTGTQGFYNLTIDKSQGIVELASDIEIRQNLNLLSGKIRTDIASHDLASEYPYEVFLSNPVGDALSSGSGYVEGNLRRAVTGTGPYFFPVGLVENELVSVDFSSPASSSTVSAAFEIGTNSAIGTATNCENDPTATIDCVFGRWNIQGDGQNDAYAINFFPGAQLQENCPDAGAFFVAKDGQLNCPEDTDISNGISSGGFTNFGVFDIATVNGSTTSMNDDCGLPEPTATFQGNRRTIIEWPAVPNANSYQIQIRFKGMDRWLLTAVFSSTRIFVHAPDNKEYEYRMQTNCAGNQSAYTNVFSWSTSGNGLVAAESRSGELPTADIVIEDVAIPSVEAFPNPVNDYLQVNYFSEREGTQLQIHHVSGKKILEKTLAKDQTIHQIDMQDLTEGIYLLSIKEKGRPIYSERMIKAAHR